MVEEIIKNARLSSSGRKLLTSEQKACIVDNLNNGVVNQVINDFNSHVCKGIN